MLTWRKTHPYRPLRAGKQTDQRVIGSLSFQRLRRLSLLVKTATAYQSAFESYSGNLGHHLVSVVSSTCFARLQHVPAPTLHWLFKSYVVLLKRSFRHALDDVRLTLSSIPLRHVPALTLHGLFKSYVLLLKRSFRHALDDVRLTLTSIQVSMTKTNSGNQEHESRKQEGVA